MKAGTRAGGGHHYPRACAGDEIQPPRMNALERIERMAYDGQPRDEIILAARAAGIDAAEAEHIITAMEKALARDAVLDGWNALAETAQNGTQERSCAGMRSVGRL